MTLGRSVTLSWKEPEDDGGCKIGTYIIEYYRVRNLETIFSPRAYLQKPDIGERFRLAGRCG